MAGFEENPGDEFEQYFCGECPVPGKNGPCTAEQTAACRRNYESGMNARITEKGEIEWTDLRRRRDR